jgi:hypothetical protein
LGDFFTTGIGYFVRPRNAPLHATSAASLYGSGIFPVLHRIFDLAGCDIDDELSQLDRVARTLETTGCHAFNMAWRARIGNPAST